MGDKNLKNESLSAHNRYRKDHGAPPLKWSTKLQNNAQKWANELAKKQTLEHASQDEEGENLSYAMGTELTGKYSTDMWYEEIKDYNFNNPGFRSGTGHFTQVVWVGSEELGVAKATSPNGKQYVVARYYPPGNNVSTFPQNVLPKGAKMQSRKPTANNAKTTAVKPQKNEKTKTDNTAAKNKKRVKLDKDGNVSASTSSICKKDGQVTPQSDSTFRTSVINAHNMYRRRHSAAPLKWNSKLAKAAQDAALEAANTNTLRAIDMENVGQNMIARSAGNLPGEDVSSVWYNEETKYNYDSAGFSNTTGKFTQMVWKGTTDIGVGRAFSSQGQTFVVALYQPPGNARGQYETNVARPTGPVPTYKPSNGCCGGGGCCSCRCTIL